MHSFKKLIEVTDVVSGSSCRNWLLLPFFPFVLGGSPSRIRHEGLSRIGSAGPDFLVLTNDSIKGFLGRRFQFTLQQEKLLEACLEDVNTVLEVGLDSRCCLCGCILLG